MKTPLISILVPAYNAEKFIATTLKSCLQQDYENFEIVIVNDGSTDNTRTVVNHFLTDPRVSYFEIDNSGAPTARNFAFSKSRGELIQYLDADDKMAKSKLSSQVKTYLEHGDDYIYSCKWGVETSTIKFHNNHPLYGNFDPLNFLYRQYTNFGAFLPVHVWLTPRKLHKKIGPWAESLRINQDGEFFCRALLSSKGIRFSADAKVYYHMTNPNSISKTRDDAVYKSWLLSYDLMTENILKSDFKKGTKEICLLIYSRFFCHLYPLNNYLLNECFLRIRRLGYKQPAPVFGNKFLVFCSGVIGTTRVLKLLKLYNR